MKRNYILYAIMSVLAAAFVGVGITGIILNIPALTAVGFVFAVAALFTLLTAFLQDNLNLECDRLFLAKRYEEERALLEKRMKRPFFFLVRLVGIYHYICVCMALDDFPNALRYIDRVRHGGGAAWKYKTAYFYILIQLDGGEIKKARAEFEDFRKWCEHAVVYRTQLQVLSAIFARLLSTRDQAPLPEAAVNSNFPVVGRILGRALEARINQQE